MTSKSLLVKLIRDDFKKRNWLIILSVLVLCLVIPGLSSMRCSRRRIW